MDNNKSYYKVDLEDETSEIDSSNSRKDKTELEWQSLERPYHQKKMSWYLKLICAAILISIVFYLLTKDLTTITSIDIGLFVLSIYGSKKPKTVNFKLNSYNLTIANRQYSLMNFKSFYSKELTDDLHEISFFPIKRFAISITVCVPVGLIDQAEDIISTKLPLMESRTTLVDIFMGWFGL